MTAPLFYFGTLISSVGSFSFNVALIAYMLQSGFHLGQASLIIALQRFLPVMIMAVWGHFADSLSPTKTVAVTELIASGVSLCLFVIWSGADTSYVLLMLACVIRSIVVSFQTGSRCKISKLLCNDSYVCNSKHAIWLNKATQGATLFGGVTAWVIIKYFNFETAVILDSLTFVINGIIILLLPIQQSEHIGETKSESWYEKFYDLLKFNQQSLIFDILLLIPMMGTVAYMARLAGENQHWIGIFMASYGLAVWVAGFLEQGPTLKFSAFPYWVTLGFSFVAISQMATVGPMLVVLLFIKDVSFWIIFHRISSYVQIDTPVLKIGSVMSARNCIVTLILTSGEVLVGAWSKVVPLAAESLFRGVFACVAGVALFAIFYRQPALADRPKL